MFLIFDTETTGLPKNFNAPISDSDNWPRLVQIAWQLHDSDGLLIEANNIIVKPEGFTIPFNAEQIHGISTEKANNEGQPLINVLEQFNQAIEKATYLIGHNIPFDINIVGAEFYRKGVANEIAKKAFIDTKDDATEYCALPGGKGGKFKFPTLSELHNKLFNKPFGEAHNAAADVEATARCFFKLCILAVIKRDDIFIKPEIELHLAEVQEQILESISYSIQTERAKTVTKTGKTTIESLSEFPFVHLHNHSQFSVLQSTSRIDSLVSKAKKDGMTAIALTDAGNMYGAFKFVSACKKAGLKSIVGCEFNICQDAKNKTFKDNGYQIVVLAKNKAGYHHLAKLCSLSFIEGFYYVPRIDYSMLEQWKENLVVLSGGLFGEIAGKILNEGETQAEEAIDWYKERFGDDFYLEVNKHHLAEEDHVNKIQWKLAQQKGVQLVATNNTFYIDQPDAAAHDILLCVKDNANIDTPKKYVGKRGREYRFGFPNDEFYFKTQNEMKKLFADIPEAIISIQQLVDKIEVFDLNREVLLPKFDIPLEFLVAEDEQDGGKRGENAYLRHLTMEGMKKRYGENPSEEIVQRIDFELKTIEKTGYPGYFLIVQDFTGQARKMGVAVGPGRGSAAGSAVAYCIGITNVDPIKYDLLFERFLNPDRVSLPDIDIDFDDEGRGAIIDWVVKKYGYEQVAQIVTYGTMAAKSAIRDTGRALGLPLSDVDRIAKLIPDISLAKLFGPRDELKAALNSENLARADQLLELSTKNDLQAKTINQARILEGSVRNTGTHACGVIITPVPITDLVPATSSKDDSLLITQFDNSVVESAGLLKMDFLGLKTLTIIRDAILLIERRHGKKIDPDDIPLDDPSTYALYQRGETNGTFQFESAGMQKYLKDLKPDRFEDLIAMNALYRPGPLEYIPNFIARKHGRETIKYDTPLMEEYLKETYGITVYQEQVMLLSQRLANFTKGEADSLRKAMGKKKKEILDELKPKFVGGCGQNGISQEVAEKVWKDWEAFAAYAFNKSHSTCYSVVAFHTAYLKANYPAEYMAAVLTHNMSDNKKVTFFMEECKRMGIAVLGPDVNESELTFTVNDKGMIRFGLGAVKGVGETAVETITQERADNGDFTSIWEFAKRINLRSVNKKCFESLAYAGAFDSFKEFTRAQYFKIENDRQTAIEKIIKYGNDVKIIEASSSQSLFGQDTMSSVSLPKIEPVEEWPLMEKLKYEKEVIGMFISGHPLDPYKHEMDFYCSISLGDLALKVDGVHTAAGLVGAAYHKVSQKGQKYGSIVIEDYSGSLELSFFREDYLKYQHFFQVGEILFVKTQLELSTFRQGEIRRNVLEMMLMDEVKKRSSKDFTLHLPLQQINEEMRKELRKLINQNPGNSKLQINVVYAQDKVLLPLRSTARVELNNQFLSGIKALDLEDNFVTNSK